MCSQRSTLSKQNILELGMTTKMSYMWHAILILLCISHYSYCIKTMFHPKAIFEYPFELLLLFFCVWFDIQILSNDCYWSNLNMRKLNLVRFESLYLLYEDFNFDLFQRNLLYSARSPRIYRAWFFWLLFLEQFSYF